MGFFRDIFKSFTMSTEEVVNSAEELIRSSDDELRVVLKEQEGLDYVKMLFSNQTIGIEEQYYGVKSGLLFKDRIRFRTIDQSEYRDVMFKDIKSIELLTDTQIHEKSKVGQMMVIGLFALATKKKTEEVTTRKLVLNAIEDGIEFSVIIDTVNDSLTEAKELNKLINEFRSVDV